MAKISPSSGEEEACPKASLLVKSVGERTSDSGFASAGHAVQPENALLITPISPCHYLLKDVDSGVGKAKRVVLLVIKIEGGLRSIW